MGGHTACAPTETYGQGKERDMGERIGVRSKADADKIKLKGLHAMLASIPIAYETNGLRNKSQKKYF